MSGPEQDKKDDGREARGTRHGKGHGPTRKGERRDQDRRSESGREKAPEQERSSRPEAREERERRPRLPGARRLRPGAGGESDPQPDRGPSKSDGEEARQEKPVLPGIRRGVPRFAPQKDRPGSDSSDHRPSERFPTQPAMEKSREIPTAHGPNGKAGPVERRGNGVEHSSQARARHDSSPQHGHPEAAPVRRGQLPEQQRAVLGVAAVGFLALTKPGRRAAEFFGNTIRREQEIRAIEAATPDVVNIHNHTEINNYGGGHHHPHSHGPTVISGCGPVILPPAQTVLLVGPPPPPPMPTIVYIQPPPPPPTVVVIQQPVVTEVHAVLSRCTHDEQRMFVMAAEAYHVTGDARAGMFAASFLESKGFAFSGSNAEVGDTMTHIGANVNVLRRGLGEHTNVAFNFVQQEGGRYGLDNDTSSFFQLNISHLDFD